MHEAQRYGSGKKFIDEMVEYLALFILNILVSECFYYCRLQELQGVVGLEE